MNDNLTLGIFIIALIITVIISKNDFRKWGELEPKDKMYILRPIILMIVVIVILIYKSKVKTVIRHYWHLAVWKVFSLHYGIIGTILY